MALILNGDCLAKMKGMADNSVDSIVTDPPYGLSFMGKKWDYDVPSTAIWREALRVLKPGGHLLSFSGSRTYHRMVVNIEDAGFEIRDQIMWIYGSGFPKSLNVSKAIDKHLGVEREKVRMDYHPDQMLMREDLNDRPWMRKAKELGYHEVAGNKPASLEAEQWDGWGTALKPAHEPIVLARKPLIGTVAENILTHDTGALNIDESRELPSGRFPANVIHDGSQEVVDNFPSTNSTVPSESNKRGGEFPNENTIKLGLKEVQRTGFNDEGSAARYFKEVSFSKNEHESIVVARKPLEGTVAENVLEHGTGGLNIDASRIKAGEDHAKNTNRASVKGHWGQSSGAESVAHSNGRFPANVIHDGSEEVLEGFPHTTSGDGKPHHITRESQSTSMSGKNYGDRTLNTFGDSGSAARFFYCAKASKSERNAGIEEAKGKRGEKGGGIRRVCEFCGTQAMEPEDCKCEVKSWINPPKKNFHPTVKPIALMEYLCRMITPPGGVVLDPFMGSGTTGIAALRLGFDFIGIEMNKDYAELATARIAHWVDMELEFDDEEVMLKRKPQAEWL